MKKILFIIGCLFAFRAQAQERDTLVLTLPAAEKLLLENNLTLLAERLNLDKAEAEKVQAKVWPNPRLSIGEFNPFVTNFQKRHAEEQASLLGSKEFGKYRQISVQIEQLVELAGKRKKREAIAEVKIEKTAAYLADFLLSLKAGFRKNIFDYHYHQLYIELLEEELNILKDIVLAYQHQSRKGNVNKSQLIRLRSSELILKDEVVREKNKLSRIHTKLIVLLNLPKETPLTFHSVFKRLHNNDSPFDMPLSVLQKSALEKHPNLLLTKLETNRAAKQLSYEKSLAVPDLTFSVGYDRGGGIYPDFIGVGVAIDLPFSNHNKGNIKKAGLELQQKNIHYQQRRLKVKAEIREKYEKVHHISRFFENINPEYLEDLEQTMASYTRNFRRRSINIVAFMDFLTTYIESKKAVFQNQRDYLKAVEELKYATGLENIIK